MKLPLLFALVFMLSAPSVLWQTDFAAAGKEAITKHRPLLLNFSGSDWCIPCIRMHKEIFDTDVFNHFADSNLVLVKADFPRSSKNRLSPEQQKANDALADKYNKKGHLPYTVLLKPDGTVLKTWDGLPRENAAAMIAEIKALIPLVNK
jgi:thioredoxin-related protein